MVTEGFKEFSIQNITFRNYSELYTRMSNSIDYSCIPESIDHPKYGIVKDYSIVNYNGEDWQVARLYHDGSFQISKNVTYEGVNGKRFVRTVYQFIDKN